MQHSYRIAKVIIRPKAVLILLLLSSGCKPSPMPESAVPSTVSKDRGSPDVSTSVKDSGTRAHVRQDKVSAERKPVQAQLPDRDVVLGRGESAKLIEGAIREQISVPSGKLTERMVWKVQELYLMDRGISDLGAIRTLRNLKVLNLRDNSISSLSPLSSLGSLEKLGLDGNLVSDLSPLADLKGLRFLEVARNPELTIGQIHKLQKILPGCTIYHDLEE